MPKKARTEAWRKKRRQEHLEMKKYRYYIFCEGQETEPNYFQGFKKWIEENPIYKDMVLIEIEPCQAETMRVIGMAEEYVKKNRLQKGQMLWSSIFVTLMANKIGGLQFGIYRNCQISSRVFHTAVAALPLTKANRSDFE